MTKLKCNICGSVFAPSMVQPHTVLCNLEKYGCIGTLTKTRNDGHDGWCVSIDDSYDTTMHVLSVEKCQNGLYDIYLDTDQFSPNTSFIHFSNAMAHLETILIEYTSWL